MARNVAFLPVNRHAFTALVERDQIPVMRRKRIAGLSTQHHETARTPIPNVHDRAEVGSDGGVPQRVSRIRNRLDSRSCRRPSRGAGRG